MIASWYENFGFLGSVAFGVLLLLVLISWVAAISGTANSNRSSTQKLILQTVLILFPPSALVILTVYIIGNHKNNKNIDAVTK